jgi:hypothetical protein
MSMQSVDALPNEGREPQVLVVFSGKGGVGKTTTAENLAYFLAALGRFVAIADTDKRAVASNLIDLSAVPPEQRYTLKDVILKDIPLHEAMYQARERLYVIPSNNTIEEANNHIITAEKQGVMIKRMRELCQFLEPSPRQAPPWFNQPSVKMRGFRPLERVSPEEVHQAPRKLDYLIFDFGADPAAIGRAILRIPGCKIVAPVDPAPFPWQAFAQMKLDLQVWFEVEPQPPIEWVIPVAVTHKRDYTTKYLIETFQAHPGHVMRIMHHDDLVPESQDIYPGVSLFEYQRSSRPTKELFETALRIDGYTGILEGIPVCESCAEILEWAQSQGLVATPGRG